MPTLIDKHGNADYFGKLSWGNLLDWFVTFCLGYILITSTLSFGAVRPETQLALLPAYALLLGLHGLWFLVEKENPKRISPLPVLFLPFAIWVAVNSTYMSSTPWLGWQEWVLVVQVLIFFWVLCNNVRTRAHLWTLIVMAVSPAANAIFIGFYQFFQNPNKMAHPQVGYRLSLNEGFLGKATGAFGDPNSFAVFLLILLPCFIIAGSVPRLPRVLRVLCIYIAGMFVVSIFFTQILWPLLVLIPVTVLVCWFAFKRVGRRIAFIAFGILSVTIISVLLFFFSPIYKRSFESALSLEGEGVRLVLAQEATGIIAENLILGSGGGSFEQKFQQSSDHTLAATPLTPHNDYLLIASNYGLLGFLLLGLPAIYGLVRSYAEWRELPFKVKLKNKKGMTMPPQKFFLSVGISGAVVFALSAAFSFTLYVPALVLMGVCFYGIAVKAAFNRTITFPRSILVNLAYAIAAITSALLFLQYAGPKLESHAKTLWAEERMAQILERRVHISGNSQLLDDVIVSFEEAIALDPQNVDAWLGLSAATCQLYYRDPADAFGISARAISHAEMALAITEDYWQAWAQLGLAQALQGDLAAAEESLKKALEMAPNSSNANFYWASFLAVSSDNREPAIEFVERALEINPNNSAARRLQQKLLIL